MLVKGAMFAFLAKLLLVARSRLDSLVSLGKAENRGFASAVLSQNLNPDILVMQPTQN